MSAHSQRRSAGSARSASSAPPRRPSLKIQNIDDLNGPQYASTVLDWIRWSSLKLEDQEREIISLKKELGREHTDESVGLADASGVKPDKMLLLEAENSVLKKELLHARATVTKELEEKSAKITAMEATMRKLSILMEMGKRITGGDDSDAIDFADLALGDVGSLIKVDTAPDWLEAEIAAASAKGEDNSSSNKGEKEDTIEEDDIEALDDPPGAIEEDPEDEEDPLEED